MFSYILLLLNIIMIITVILVRNIGVNTPIARFIYIDAGTLLQTAACRSAIGQACDSIHFGAH